MGGAKTKDISLEELDPPIHIHQCLSSAGIRTIQDLCSITLNDVRNIRNLGDKKIEDIVKAVEEKTGIDIRAVWDVNGKKTKSIKRHKVNSGE